MNLDTAVNYALAGDALLFVGAGFSRTPDTLNSKGEKLKNGKELSSYLLTLAGVGVTEDIDISLDKAAEFCINEFSKKNDIPSLIEELKSLFTIHNWASWQEIIINLPWRRVYTTNYDDLVESVRANKFRELGLKKILSATSDDNVREYFANPSICVHLNGFVHKINQKNLYSSFKLSNSSYVNHNVADGQWGQLFRTDIMAARAVFFIGYSLYDIDLQRIINSTSSDKMFFINGGGNAPCDIVNNSMMSSYGYVTGLSGEDFSKKIECQKVGFIKPDLDDPIYSFEHILPPEEHILNISDRYVIDLLLWGSWHRELIWLSFAQEKSYMVRREKLTLAIDYIKRGSDLIVTGDLGNGKTIFSACLGVLLEQSGIETYVFKSSALSVEKDILKLAISENPKVIIFDDYFKNKYAVDALLRHRRENLVIVINLRTVDFQISSSEVREHFQTAELVNLDVLSDNELVIVDELIFNSGLWGKYANKNHSWRINFLRNDLEGQFQKILLELLKSDDIKNRLVSYLDFNSLRQEEQQLVIAALVCNVLGHVFTITSLGDLVGCRVMPTIHANRDDFFSRAFDISNDHMNARSSVVSRFCLRSLIPSDLVFSTLEMMLESAADGRHINKRFDHFFKDMSLFRNIRQIIPEHRNKQMLFRYFEVLKNIGESSRNPLFWLQYAIARLFEGELDVADKYFETAYSLAESRKGFDKYQIDNHYARYLLESSIEINNFKVARDAFLKARVIIEKQLTYRENRHYPFKVASSYEVFYSTYKIDMDDEFKKSFLQSVKKVLSYADIVDQSLFNNRDINTCRIAMNRIVRSAENI